MKDLLIKRALDYWRYTKFAFFSISLLVCGLMLQFLLFHIFAYKTISLSMLVVFLAGIISCLMSTYYIIRMSLRQGDFILINQDGIRYHLHGRIIPREKEGFAKWQQVKRAYVMVEKMRRSAYHTLNYHYQYDLILINNNYKTQTLPLHGFGYYDLENEDRKYLYNDGIHHIPIELEKDCEPAYEWRAETFLFIGCFSFSTFVFIRLFCKIMQIF